MSHSTSTSWDKFLIRTITRSLQAGISRRDAREDLPFSTAGMRRRAAEAFFGRGCWKEAQCFRAQMCKIFDPFDGEISLALEIELKTASEHLRRLTLSGLILKRHEGREVRHALTSRADNILTFLRM